MDCASPGRTAATLLSQLTVAGVPYVCRSMNTNQIASHDHRLAEIRDLLVRDNALDQVVVQPTVKVFWVRVVPVSDDNSWSMILP